MSCLNYILFEELNRPLAKQYSSTTSRTDQGNQVAIEEEEWSFLTVWHCSCSLLRHYPVTRTQAHLQRQSRPQMFADAVRKPFSCKLFRPRFCSVKCCVVERFTSKSNNLPNQTAVSLFTVGNRSVLLSIITFSSNTRKVQTTNYMIPGCWDPGQVRSQPVFSGKPEGPFCLSCTFIFQNERNWMRKSARVSEKLVSPDLPGLQVATGLLAPLMNTAHEKRPSLACWHPAGIPANRARLFPCNR